MDWKRNGWPDAKFEGTSAKWDLRNEQQREKREESRERREKREESREGRLNNEQLNCNCTATGFARGPGREERDKHDQDQRVEGREQREEEREKRAETREKRS